MRWRGLEDQRGAVAIEYAVIGALIGIGLIGALVGTRGSLSAIFGVASSQMGSATANPGASSTVPDRSAFWAQKTLSAKTYPNSNAVRYTYTDGTEVNLSFSGTTPTALQVIYKDASGNPTYYNGFSYNADGSKTNFSVTTLYPGSWNPSTGESSSGAQITNGVPTLETIYSYNSSGNLTGTATDQAVTSTYATRIQALSGDAQYFFGLPR